MVGHIYIYISFTFAFFVFQHPIVIDAFAFLTLRLHCLLSFLLPISLLIGIDEIIPFIYTWSYVTLTKLSKVLLLIWSRQVGMPYYLCRVLLSKDLTVWTS